MKTPSTPLSTAFGRLLGVLLPWLVLLLALRLLTGCTGGRPAEQLASAASEPASSVATYTTAGQFEAPVPADTLKAATGW